MSDATRQAVLAAVELLGYERPSQPRRLRSGLVGLIVPELDNPIFPRFVQEIESALAAHGYAPLLCTATPVLQENEYVDMLLERDVAGILFVAGRHANTEVDHSRYHELRAASLPIVLVNGYVEGLDAVFVSTDEAESMRRAVEHLHSLGHRRIGCAVGPARYITSQRKVSGYLRALADEEAGERLVVHAIYSLEGGHAATAELLERRVTGVVCGSDLMALSAIRAARARGLRVPQDVSVVGYDDSSLLAFTDPPLTTMRQDVAGMSRHAVDALLDEIQGIPHPRAEALFRTELVLRGSTGPAQAGRS